MKYIRNSIIIVLGCLFFASCSSLSVKKVVMTNESMLPNIKIGDQLKYTTSFNRLTYSDLVVFELDENEEEIHMGGTLLFRVVGLPGDSIGIENHICVINGRKNKNFFVQKIKNKDAYVKELEYWNEYEEVFPNKKAVKVCFHETNFSDVLSDYPTVFVPEDHYFLMGDFRSNAYDSRYIGTIPLEKIKGKVIENVESVSGSENNH